MNRKIASLTVLFGLSLLFSTLFYSCESNMKPAYVGSWIAYDSSDFKTKNGEVERMIWTFTENNVQIAGGLKNNTSPDFADLMIISGKLSVFSQYFTMDINSISVYDSISKQMLTVGRKTPEFGRDLDIMNMDTLSTYNFKISKGVMLMSNEDTTYVFHRK
jgi:hypothetical protein